MRGTPAGRMRHRADDCLPRHRHASAFAAVVLGGGYVEAGDTGRHRTVPGDVILHRPFEAHLDRFAPSGAEVLVIPLAIDWNTGGKGRVADPDLVARIAERDVEQARTVLLEQMFPVARQDEDWPDALAAARLDDPGLSIGAWAGMSGIHPGSLSRGFRQQFGITPAAFRTIACGHRAISAILGTDEPLAEIAADAGFSDQSHMNRAVRALCGQSPGRLRRTRSASQAFG